MKYVFYGLVALVALVVGAAAVGPAFVDWNAYKDDIAREVRAATGRSLVIDGDINLALLPSPRLFVSGVRLRPDGGTVADMVRLKSLRLDVMLMPLLRGEVQVASMTLTEPVITVSVGKDGRTNWDTDKRAVEGETLPASPGASQPAAEARPTRFRLDNMRIRDGGFVYRDARTGVERRFERLNADMSAATLYGPYDIKAELDAQGLPVSIRARVGEVAGRPSAPVEVLATITDQPETRLEFKGRLVSPATAPRMVGKIKGRSSDVGALLALANGEADAKPGSGGWAGVAFGLDAELDATPAAASLNDLAVTLGDMRLGGGVSAALGTKPEIDVTLRARRLDAGKLQRLFGTAGKAAGSQSAKRKGRVTDRETPGDASLFPKELGGSIDLAVDSLTHGKMDFRRLRIEATLADGALKIGKASVAMPGGGLASVSGRVTSDATGSKFGGKLKFKADDLRAVLAWAGVDTSSVSRDRLRKAQLSAKLTVDPKFIRVADLDARLDGSIVKGGANYALRARPAFGASLALDVLNLDGYLAQSPKKPAAKKTDSDKKKPTTRVSEDWAFLSGLNDFDANFSLSVGQLTFRQTPVRGIRANLSLLRGKLTIDKASVRSLGGAGVQIAGTVTGFDKTPVFKGKIGAEAKNVVGLMRLAGLKPTTDIVKLGGMKLDAKADIDNDAMTLDAKLDFAGGKASLDGKLANYRTKPSLDFKVDGRHPDLPRFAALFGMDIPGAKARSRALNVKGTIKGPPKKIALNSELAAFGASATVAGTVSSPGDDAVLDLAIQTSHPDFAALMRDVAVDYRPKGGKSIGPASLRATVKGRTEKLAFSGLRAAVGPATVSGDGELRLGGKRPVLMAKLTAGDLVLDPLMPTDGMPADGKSSGKGAGKGKAGKKSGRAGKREGYSREPLDVAFLDAMDGTVSLNAASLSRGDIRVEKPALSVVIKDRVLTLTKADGRIFKGAFKLTGTLDGRGVPAIAGKLALKGAQVEKALLNTAELDFASGIFDLDMALNSAGESERDLVSALKGNAAIKARDGVIKGFDLPAVSKQLKDINRGTDVLSLLSAGMGGGSTPFSRLTGTFKVVKGVARTNNLTLVADGGTGRSKGSVNLAAWTVDLLTTFAMTEHTKAPPFTMRTVGPLGEPSQVFKFNKLQKYLLRRSMSRFIKKVLPEVREPAPSSPRASPAGNGQPQSQPKRKKKSKADDILRGLLQGLEKR